MAGYLIGVDIGTQGTKAVLFDTKMNAVATAFEESKLISPKPGVVWQEADDIFFSVSRTIHQLMSDSGISPKEVLSIGIDSQMAGIMGIDENGEATTYYDSWLDTRCEKYMNEMKTRAGKKITAITGGPITYTHGPKILWWKQEHPDIYEKTYKFVLPHAYVVGKMTGLKGEEAYFDYTCIQYSGFGDNKNKVWSKELLDLFDIDEKKMARIVSPFEVVGHVTKEFAEISGLTEGIPVVAGAGDTAASVFGSGMFDNGLILDCAGTASVLCSVVNEFVPDTEFETMTMMRSPVDGYWFPLAYINGGGLCVRWFRDEFTGKPPVSYRELEDKAAEIAPGSEGVLFVPHFAGRVLPNNPDVKGSFVGLDWKHTREHLFRSVMEGISYEYAYYLDVMKQLYPHDQFTQMYAIGGGAKSELFLSIKADVLGVEVTSFETGDTGLIGSAVIAGVGAGFFSDYKKPIQDVMKERQKISFNPEHHKAYQPYAKTYLNVIDSLTGVYQSEIYHI
jgi:xylulokinase